VHRVLIVEDDADAREAIRDLLEEEGYRVACAENGREAIDLLRKNPEPCLILLDLIMPVASGWQFRAAQLQDPFLAGFPVVVMTAASSLEEAAINADGLLRKPLSLEALLATVARHCTPSVL
jgi:CheY-like chemotaxis protein